jgi:ankyrin repeat protein
VTYISAILRLANGAETALKNDEGQDALAIATKEGYQKIVKALIGHQARGTAPSK